MAHHVIIGAGAVGSTTAHRLTSLGHQVTVVTRSGSQPAGPLNPDIRTVAGDASDAAALARIADGTAAIHNCANPPYHRWATDWPPLSQATIAAAEATGARLVIMSNLYGFARGASPMSAAMPLDPPSAKGAIRAQMWADALSAHDAGRIEAVEVRASDFFGPGLGDSAHLGDRAVDAALATKTVRVVGPPDVPHSWTYIGDVAATLAVAGTDPRATGRAWHVPTLAPLTASQMMSALCSAAGRPEPKVRQIPRAALKAVGIFSAQVRELGEVLYQFDAPFEIDASDTTDVFGLHATPLFDQMRSVIEAPSDATAATA